LIAEIKGGNLRNIKPPANTSEAHRSRQQNCHSRRLILSGTPPTASASCFLREMCIGSPLPLGASFTISLLMPWIFWKLSNPPYPLRAIHRILNASSQCSGSKEVTWKIGWTAGVSTMKTC